MVAKRSGIQSAHLEVFAAEFIGTAVLVLAGLSLVILMLGSGSPIVRVVPSEGLRRLITGFFFGATGALIALSPVSKVSGAHINPVVTLGFRPMGKMQSRLAAGYIVSQFVGTRLLLWGSMGRSVAFGSTLPGQGYSLEVVLLGEVITTFGLVAGLCVFLGFRKLRPFTPWLFPFLYALMVYLEAPISGTSTNRARSLGPSIVSGQWQGWWIYWIGSVIGTFLALVLCTALAVRIEVAKLYHFDSARGLSQLLHAPKLGRG